MDEKWAASIAGQVRSARRARGWTQDELGKRSTVAPGTVGRIEKGLNVRQGSLRAVLDALGLEALAERQREPDDGIKTALEIVEQYLAAIEDKDERHAAIMDLARFVTSRQVGR